MRVEVEPEKVEEAFAEVTKDFQREARFPGFRPGKSECEQQHAVGDLDSHPWQSEQFRPGLVQ